MFVAGFIGSPPMNFVPARVEDGTLELPVRHVRPARRSMRAAVGDRDHVMVGIRPERFEDVALVDDDEAGSGCHVHGRASTSSSGWATSSTPTSPTTRPITWRPASSELERELDSERMRSQLVVALDPTSRIDDNSDAALWLDPRRMHIFDPHTGDNLTVGLER